MLSQVLLVLFQKDTAVLIIVAHIGKFVVVMHAPGIMLHRYCDFVSILQEADALEGIIKVPALQIFGIPRQVMAGGHKETVNFRSERYAIF